MVVCVEKRHLIHRGRHDAMLLGFPIRVLNPAC